MSVTQPAVRVQDEDVGTGAACTYRTQGRVPAPATLGPSPSPGYSSDLPSLGHPRWERVKEAMGMQQGPPPTRAKAQSQLGHKAVRTPGRAGAGDGHPSPGTSPALHNVAMLPGGDSVALMKAS